MKAHHFLLVALAATSLVACKNISSGMNPRDRHPERKGEVLPQVSNEQNGNYYGVLPQQEAPQQDMRPSVAQPVQQPVAPQ